jgi:hypothetical protein
MQTLLAPIPTSRSPFARLSVKARLSLRRMISRLRRLARAAAALARAGVDRLGSIAPISSLARDPAVEAWLALGREVRRRRRLAGTSSATAPKLPLPREGARILLLHSGKRPSRDATDERDGTPPVTLRITM